MSEQRNIIVWTLRDIVHNLNQGMIVIPPVQRGLVWNAVRCEVLWDSLMRGIPIGFLSVRRTKENKWDLLDGQQRVNAISMGYADFPPINMSVDEADFDNNKRKEKPILWIDLCPPNIKTERLFYFMVTTASQPWGYNITMDERGNNRLLTKERPAIGDIDWKNKGIKGTKPYPFELYPQKARMAFPFSIVRAFIEDKPDSSFDDFLDYCREAFGQYNWMKRIEFLLHNNGSECQDWKEIKDAVGKINKTSIAANIINIDDSDIGIFFQRLNKSGYESSNEEIHYSRLKARIPELQKIDTIAYNQMAPSRLAYIAIMFFNSIVLDKCITNVSASDIALLCNTNDMKHSDDLGTFRDFICNKLDSLLKTTENLMCYSDSNTIGVPRVIYSSIPYTYPCLFVLILRMVKENANNNITSKELSCHLIALCTIILLLHNQIRNYDIKATQAIYGVLRDNHFTVNMLSMQTCICRLTKMGFLSPPFISLPAPLQESIVSTITKENWTQLSICDINMFKSSLRDSFGLNQLWHWQSEQGRFLLLYATRYYIYKTFYTYSPLDGRWNEENRPWDYDHIFPQDWIKETKNPIVEFFINSIGNIAPIPFSQNRGKSDSPPGNYLNDDNQFLFVVPSDLFVSLENFKNDQFQGFLQFALTRFSTLFVNWLSALNIGEFFDFRNVDDARKRLFTGIQKRIPNAVVFFTNTDTGLQYECSNSIDWARPWLAIGIQVEDSNSVFPAVAWDGYSKKIEIGLRRHPKKSNIDQKKDVWYMNARCQYVDFRDEDNVAENLAKMLLELEGILKDIQCNPSSLAYSLWLDAPI